MSFRRVMEDFSPETATAMIASATERAVDQALARASNGAQATVEDFAALISPAAAPRLETMARLARDLTRRNFGRTIQLFTPLYLSDHCSNHCVYCGFNAKTKLRRSALTMEELRAEAEAIASTGLKHLLILTGESPKQAGTDYLVRAMDVLRPLFPSVSIEVFAMTREDYRRMAQAGADGMTMFQETYNRARYEALHPAGPKRDFLFRLDAPERACQAGMRTVNLGALLGLDQWRRDVFFTGLHVRYIQKHHPEVDAGLSLPRFRPHVGETAGGFKPEQPVTDRELVQAMTALRLFLPRASITISTREAPDFRDNILPLGVTRMSAGVSTAVGGHTGVKGQAGQFDISDPRSVDELCDALRARGYQPVFKDWEFLEEACA